MDIIFIVGRVIFGGYFLLFLLPVTFMVHTFWKTSDPMEKMSERIQFEKNMALLGAALMLAALSQPWPLSL